MDNQLETLSLLGSFEGKRNCALTFFIPPNSNFRKDLQKVNNTILSIKHKNKQKQLKQVMYTVQNKIKNITRITGNGRIICCGMDKKSSILYHNIVPNRKIDIFEYSFDYEFNTNKIKENLFHNWITTPSPEENIEWVKRIPQYVQDESVVYYQELEDYINTNMVYPLIYLGTDEIPQKLLTTAVKRNLKVVLINNEELEKKYGKLIGILRYKDI